MAGKKCPPPGLPAWVMTFADLMSLLMCFFVLLLSFAQMDVVKFRDVAGSMRDAFGQDMSSRVPGTLNDQADKTFEMDSAASSKDSTGERRPGQSPMSADMEALHDALAKELSSGVVTIEDGGGKIAVRIDQVQAFPSGSSDLLPGFLQVLDKVAEVLVDSDAAVHVDGHTDNVPISGGRFHSNWELSAARAASVATRLLENRQLDSGRFEIRGHADTKPLFPNDSPDHRAANRRIEVVLDYDDVPPGTDETSTEDANTDETAADAADEPS